MDRLRIVVLGSNGMLGHMVCERLEKNGCEIFPSYRSTGTKFATHQNSFYFDADLHNEKLSEIIPQCDFIINCIGSIPQRNISYQQMFSANCMLPIHLGEFSIKTSIPVIHITTDCVFSGMLGMYHEDDKLDATDDYGILKAAGESRNVMSLRTSIIGPEDGTSYNLLEWTKQQAGKDVFGYENHTWNGLTTKELAKVIWKIIDEKLYCTGVFHIFSSRPITKYQMIRAINEKYHLNINLKRHSPIPAIDRTLSTKFELCEKLGILSFEDMLRELDE